MRKPTTKTLKLKADRLFSQLVRMRNVCEWCGAKNDTLQCAHVFSRKYLNTRWASLNCLCLCAKCHFKAHQEPVEFVEFVKKYLGEETYAELRRLRHKIYKPNYPQLIEELQTKLATAKEVYE
ncbi:MAG: hypothetical protein ACOX6V_05470 [Patescibacteria group bacterium]